MINFSRWLQVKSKLWRKKLCLTLEPSKITTLLNRATLHPRQHPTTTTTHNNKTPKTTFNNNQKSLPIVMDSWLREVRFKDQTSLRRAVQVVGNEWTRRARSHGVQLEHNKIWVSNNKLSVEIHNQCFYNRRQVMLPTLTHQDSELWTKDWNQEVSFGFLITNLTFQVTKEGSISRQIRRALTTFSLNSNSQVIHMTASKTITFRISKLEKDLSPPGMVTHKLEWFNSITRTSVLNNSSNNNNSNSNYLWAVPKMWLPNLGNSLISTTREANSYQLETRQLPKRKVFYQH